uniref:Uncharacterized protein n=1 Tax=Arundo donax TaxID=35708 RepID=A0A0A9C717_ARUDO
MVSQPLKKNCCTSLHRSSMIALRSRGRPFVSLFRTCGNCSNSRTSTRKS